MLLDVSVTTVIVLVVYLTANLYSYGIRKYVACRNYLFVFNTAKKLDIPVKITKCSLSHSAVVVIFKMY